MQIIVTSTFITKFQMPILRCVIGLVLFKNLEFPCQNLIELTFTQELCVINVILPVQVKIRIQKQTNNREGKQRKRDTTHGRAGQKNTKQALITLPTPKKITFIEIERPAAERTRKGTATK